MTKLAIELSEFEVSFKAMTVFKAQWFVVFLAEMTLVTLESDCAWVVFMNDSSNSMGISVSVIVENIFGLAMELSIRFKFSTTNNQVEYTVAIKLASWRWGPTASSYEWNPKWLFPK